MLVSSHVLAEVAQTVDHVLIISRGKLVRESPLDELTAGIGGAVRVRSPQAGRLREALERDGIDRHGRRRRRSSPARRATASARSPQRPASSCTSCGSEQSSLEEVFLELTTEKPE